MTLPANAVLKDGMYFSADGVGPCVYTGTQLIPLAQAIAAAGTIEGVGRTAGGMILNYTQISTNTTTVIKTGQTLYGGIIVYNAGTTWVVAGYDNIAASGTIVIPVGSSVSGTGKLATDCCPSGVGILMTNGLTIVTSGAAAGILGVLWA